MVSMKKSTSTEQAQCYCRYPWCSLCAPPEASAIVCSQRTMDSCNRGQDFHEFTVGPWDNELIKSQIVGGNSQWFRIYIPARWFFFCSLHWLCCVSVSPYYLDDKFDYMQKPECFQVACFLQILYIALHIFVCRDCPLVGLCSEASQCR